LRDLYRNTDQQKKENKEKWNHLKPYYMKVNLKKIYFI
jgi:hypothetical protein